MGSENLALIPTLGGQIVRIYLENFMTYDATEIRPGYHLNMIIGPNGTGKSTVVCAVLLGLGGKAKTLGRADQISSFVKSGCDQSLIEIELYDPNGENIVIRRLISTSNHSQFYVDGVQVPASKVNEIRARFNIQVDNLCTFLPQEKVQDFAKMNPQQLLEHTEKTIGDGELLAAHEKLKTLRADLVASEQVKRVQDEQIQTEMSKNERLSSKVQAIKEKQELCDKVILLNQKKHWMQFHEAVKEKEEVDKDVALAQANMVKKRKEVDSVQRELQVIENNSKTQQEASVIAKREEAAKRAVVEDRLERLQHRLDKFDELEGTLTLKTTEEETKKKQLRHYEAMADKLSNDLNALDDSSDVDAGLKQKDHKLAVELKRKHEEEVELARTKGADEENLRSLQQEQRNVAAERRLLENRRSLRLDYLKRQEPDVYKSVVWLEQNQSLFHGKVYNPMLLELNVKDPKMARVVEATIPYNDLLAFTVTYGDDLNTLVKHLRVEMKLRINIVTAEDTKGTQYSPSVPMSQLRNYGFHSFVKDFIVGPEPIIQYLCRSHKVHNIPVGNSSVQAKSDSIPNSIRKYFSDDQVFDVRVSSYSGGKSTTVRRLGDPRFFTESVDVTKIAALDKKEKEIGRRLEKQQGACQQMAQTQQRLREAVDELRQRRREIATRLQERERLLTQLTQARANVEASKKSLRNPQELQQEIQREKQELETALNRMMVDLKKAQIALEVAYLKRCKASVLLKASRIGIDNVQLRQVQAQDALRTALDATRLVEERQHGMEAKCNRARQAARSLTDGHCPGDRSFRTFQTKFEKLKDSVSELEAELEETQARADFLDGGSAQLLIEYNKREEDIERMKNDSETLGSKVAVKVAQLEKLREEWLRPINELLTTVDVNVGGHFASMGCAGEVSLLVPDDPNEFDSYGVRIRVKFREGMPLQDLSRHFQSGGERAVSTAIYMIALQHLTSVPFRFVDEINQGMDPANERRITELIIRVTTPRDSSQYFFITPKLLTDLACPLTMSLICVHNGPAAIRASEWDVGKFLQRALGLDSDEDL